MLFEGKECEETRKVGGAKCFLGWAFSRSRRLVVPQSFWRATQAFSVILRCSQSFPGIPSRLVVS